MIDAVGSIQVAFIRVVNEQIKSGYSFYLGLGTDKMPFSCCLHRG